MTRHPSAPSSPARRGTDAWLLRLLLPLLLALAGCGRTDIRITRLEDAAHARVGVMTGTTGEAITKARFPEAKVKSFDDIMDAVAALKSRQLDAIVTGYPAALQVSKKNHELLVLPEPLANEDTAVALRQTDTELLAKVNAIIDELRADGTLQSLRRRWFKPDLGPYDEPTIPLPQTGTPLRIGVSATREPFSFVDQTGRITGHDGELARRIASKLNRPVEFSNMKFMALIPALQSGKVDLIITGMTATQERRQHVAFSQPYFANAQVMIVLRPAGTAPGSITTFQPDARPTPPTIAAAPPTALARLATQRIVVLPGSAGDLAARRRFPGATFQTLVAAADAALAVKNHKADAFIYDRSVLLNLAEKDPDLILLDEPVDKLEIAAAIRLDNTDLRDRINAVLAALRQEGVLEQLRARWVESKYTTPPPTRAEFGHGDQTLKMGTCATIEPFSFLAHGSVAGLDIELGSLIASRLGRPLEVVDMSFQALIPALQAGKIDFALSNFNVTEERKKLVLFSSPYIANDISALVRRPEKPAPPPPAPTGKLTSVQDLATRRIGVLMGSAHDTYATRNYPNATILQYKTPADVALAVKAGKVDAALFDADPLREIMREDESFGLLGDPLFSFDVGAGFSKENPALRDQFNAFLRRLREDGTYRDLVERWMERRDTRMPAIPKGPTSGPLVAGVCDTGMPFAAVQDGRLVGLDIELVERFAASIGREIQFANMEFGSLIAAVSTRKVDLIIASIYVTDERKKQIDFSDPYYQMGTRVFALKSNLATPGSAAASLAPTTRLASLSDLHDKRIGVVVGTVHDTYANQHYPRADILQYKSPSDLILAVRSGKADAGIYTRETLLQITREDPQLGLLGGPLESYPIGMGFHQTNDTLRQQFNAFLQTLRTNGVHADMVRRWIDQGDTHMPDIPNPRDQGVLVVGTVSDKGLPFTIARDGRLIGFDIELVERFGAFLRKEVRFSDMEFGGLIGAAAAGKIDMIASTLILTDERKSRIDFSDPYHALGASVFALQANIVGPAQAESTPPTPATRPSFLRRIANSFHSNVILERRYLLIWDGLKTTVVIAIFSTLFGSLLGSLICAMRMSRHPLPNRAARLYISILRGTPVLVLLMLIFYVVFASVNINPVVVAVIAFGMNFAAYVSEIFRTGIESIDRGQTEAGISLGFTRFQTFRFIVLPQTLQRILPVYKGEFISLVKMTSIVGYIAVQDLTKASDIIRSRTFDAFFPLVMVAILYFTISWSLMQSLEYLERITDPKRRRRRRAPTP